MISEEMTPIDWALRPVKKYAVFSGRAPRAEYWWFATGSSLVSLLLLLVDRAIATPIFADYGPLRTFYLLVMALPSYAVTVRRLHDIEATGWWLLARVAGWLLVIGPMYGFDWFYFRHLSGWLMAAWALVGVGWLCAEINLLVFTFIRGTQGPNDYGPDPYGPDSLEEVFA